MKSVKHGLRHPELPEIPANFDDVQEPFCSNGAELLHS